MFRYKPCSLLLAVFLIGMTVAAFERYRWPRPCHAWHTVGSSAWGRAPVEGWHEQVCLQDWESNVWPSRRRWAWIDRHGQVRAIRAADDPLFRGSPP